MSDKKNDTEMGVSELRQFMRSHRQQFRTAFLSAVMTGEIEPKIKDGKIERETWEEFLNYLDGLVNHPHKIKELREPLLGAFMAGKIGPEVTETQEAFLNCLNELTTCPIEPNEIEELRIASRYEIHITYIETLLNEARRYNDSKEFGMSCLLYATWLEHLVNLIISIACERRGLKVQDIINVIRSNQFIDKLGWLWVLLELEPIEDTYKGKMYEIVQYRNEFAHYKWRTKTVEGWVEYWGKIADVVRDFDEVVTYMSNYFEEKIMKTLGESGGSR